MKRSIVYSALLGVLLYVLVVAVAGAQTGTNADNDRVGETLLLQGQVLDTDGNPVAGAVVEIWQTDVNGNYNHPNDASPDVLLDDFQYFGTATTGEDGYYAFYTVKPNAYDNRPPHIHFKVKIDGEEVLTSQFYFIEDREVVENDGAFASAGDTLFLETSDQEDENGDLLRLAIGEIVLDLNGSDANTLEPTPSQTEGPYYPVVDFSDYDNNLISTADGDETVMPMMATFSLLNLNTASGNDFLTVPDVGDRMVREFMEYRPYVSIVQFRREIGKYVDEAQVAAYEAYVYVPVDVNNSDAETLKQIPGVDVAIAEALIAARPFESNQAFLEALGNHLSSMQVDYAANFLEAE